MSHRYIEAIRKRLQTYIPVKVVFILRLILGCYYKNDTSKTVSVLLKLYCVFFACSTVFASIFMNSGATLYSTDMIIYYVIIVLTSLITEERNFFAYCAATESAIDVLCWQRVRIESDNHYFLLFLSVMNRVFLSLQSLEFMKRNPHTCTSLLIVYSVIDYEYIITALKFDIMYQRMKLLRESFEQLVSTAGDEAGSREVSVDLHKYMLIYKKLMDVMPHQEIECQFKLSLAFSRCVINSVTVVFNNFAVARPDYEWTTMVDITYKIGVTYFATCVPAVFAELITNETEKIYGLLTKVHINCTDTSVRAEAERGVTYLRLRPARADLLRVLRLDSSLLIAIGSTCFTFSLIALQFYNYI